MDTGKLGCMRDIEMTDLRSVLLFLHEYPLYRKEPNTASRRMAFADEVDWL